MAPLLCSYGVFAADYSMNYVYSDAKCTEAKTGSERLERKNDERLFIKMNLKLHRKGQKSIYSTNGMFFGLTDIDAAQSYKILNHGNELTQENG